MTFEEMRSRFEKVCEQNSEFGANDSEPHMILRGLIRKALNGEGVSVPDDAEGWSLYDKPGADIVGETLGEEALPMVMMARNASAVVRFARS